jgi:hypothetical protein
VFTILISHYQIRFTHTKPFDRNGYLYYIATRGKTREWINPHNAGFIKVSANPQHATNGYNDEADIVSHDQPGKWGSESAIVNTYASIDLLDNPPLCPNYYALSHTSKGWTGKIKNWDLKASNDGVNWNVLRSHRKDESVTVFSKASWPIKNVNNFYRYFRIVQTGPNSDESFRLGK